MITRRNNSRSQEGAVLLLSIGGTVLISILGTLLFYLYQDYFVSRERAQQAAQAAAVKAACELSRIVISDPHWGFVSLSDHPACGTATVAPDNEPLPITGYNTIAASVRGEELIAQNLSSKVLSKLAQDDYEHYIRLKKSLQFALSNSLSPDCKLDLNDMDGKPVKIYQNALNSFTQNMPEVKSGKMKIKSFSLSLGWLQDGSTTMTADPEAQNESPDTPKKYYRSFVDTPVGNNHFYFAGVSSQARLVEAARFRAPDDKRFVSCIKIQVEIESANNPSGNSIMVSAAALPYNENNYYAPGVLAVFLPQGTTRQLSSLSDLISNPALNRMPAVRSVASNDFPIDRNATLVRLASTDPISQGVGRALFDWLRTCQARNIRLNSILSAFNHQFTNSSLDTNDLVVIYSVDKLGNIQINTVNNAGFQRKIVADGQSYDTVGQPLLTDKGQLSIEIRNHVINPGVNPLGKHGGQPLCSELPSAFCSFTAEEESKKAREHENKMLRASYYKGGLAAAIELNFTGSGG